MPPSDGSLAHLFRSRVLVLDGATGTELERRGVPTPRPLWSAAALLTHPDLVAAIHRDYVAAGADILVANTFRTNARALRAAGLFHRGQELNRRAVALARQASSAASRPTPGTGTDGHRQEATAEPRSPTDATRPCGRPVLVAASLAPVEDCYSPQLAPQEALLLDEHRQMLGWLTAANPDLVWIETMNTVREARAAARVTTEAQMPFVVSFVVREDGNLLSGERLEEAVAAVEPLAPLAIGLNCIPPAGLTALLPRLRRATGRPLVAYAHINNPAPITGWSYSQMVGPEEYAEHVRRWLDLGASVVGGCCGTTPAHIRAIRDALDRQAH